MFDGAAVRSEMASILASPAFANSPRMCRFLKFVVEETLAGKGDRIKEYAIAVEVFDKKPDYDPKTDSTVRTEASKLRARLDRYYETQGKDDALLIAIPKGTYVPVFSGRPVQPDVGAKTIAGRGWWISLAAGSLILLSSITWFVARRSATRTPYFTPIPLTSYPGQELEPSFSPDGNAVAFMWNRGNGNNFDIYVKQIGGADKPLQITSDPAKEFSPAWSPDGRFIAFGRLLGGTKCGIFVVPALGGPEQKIAETRAPSDFWPHPFIAWSPDSKWLVTADSDNPGEVFGPTGYTPASLFLLSIQTGERRKLLSHPSGSIVDGGPSFAPGGRMLAFLRVSGQLGEIYLVRLSAGLVPEVEPRRLTSLNRFITSTSWTADGKELVFASGGMESTRLWRVAANGGGAPRPLGIDGNHPTISHQGHLAWSQISSDTNIWGADLSGPGLRTGTPRPLIASTRADLNPQFSPDGKRIVFCSDRGGSMEIWVSDKDGSNAMQLTSMGAVITGSPRWSPDGTRIVFDSNKEGQFELYAISASGGAPQRLTNNPAADGVGSWSHDGRWIYFMSNRSGVRSIWKMPATGGDAVQVTKHRGHVALESPDGKFVYFSERAGEGERNGTGGLWRLPVSGGDETPVLPSVTFLNFAVVNDGIYFIPRADQERRYSIEFFSFRTRKSWRVLTLSGGVSNGLSVSPDGRTLVYSQKDETKSDLMLIENFR